MAQTVLYIGAHGKVGQLTLPRARDAGLKVTALVRNPAYESELRELGAHDVLIRDITTQTVDDWASIFADFDVVVWGAGNGGRAGADVTTAVDKDGELRVIDALDSMTNPPFYLTINYLGWDAPHTNAEGASGSWSAYADAKVSVGKRLGDVTFAHTILAPGVLTTEPAAGGVHVPNNPSDYKHHPTTSRELVAQTIVEHALAPQQDSGTWAFIDAGQER